MVIDYIQMSVALIISLFVALIILSYANKKIQKSTYTTMNNDVRASKKSHGKITYTVCLATVSYPSDGYAPSSH